ncbi:uncharacterized protein SPAPADRAFT_146877 [Spathaspora passalidarum NRRL Y-27907]|uniref:Nodulin-like domain-containing protein n=1 Tax=Spathaspora passalidarum (strain NRRL Y-27907 / 11-Y1) TaxID=619300 RepID=G3AHA0_SPAPN|nr:uncharacterized protein SPAPADRAFT_146877 [Spathaspora passalidarum NRRL Y-27907]EGW35530.1 hypothetical protein SPAPADRAFT_146877 [Spathaspora passalidarum NRRL Y-27907]
MSSPPLPVLERVASLPIVTDNSDNLTSRLISLFISVLVALASGTLYLYGVYSPQFIKRVGLTTSDSATIALSMTMGSGIGGLPAGLIVDKYGPMFSTRMGSICILVNYYLVYRIYLNQHDNLLLICMCMAFVGFGSIICYFSTLKASQANFPNHRGGAGALPVSAYGFAATIFSIISARFFDEDTGGLLRFLSIFCGCVSFIGSFFIRVYHEVDHHEDYHEELGVGDGQNEELALLEDQNFNPTPRPVDSEELYGSFAFWGIGEHTPQASDSESSSLLELQSPPKLPRITPQIQPKPKPHKKKHKIKPLEAIKHRVIDAKFLIHYLIVAITTGIGQMYIYSIGFIVTAQYYYNRKKDEEDLSKDPETVHLQAVQVAVISISSFLARLVAGFLSDVLHRRKFQRLWIVLVTIIIQCLGELLLVVNESNHTLISISSGIMGSCYGLVFGTYPAIMADEFGTKTFSTNWGLVCTGYVITLFILTKYFGWIYDKNTNPVTGHCYKGNGCYIGAFELGMILSGIAFVATCTVMWKHRIQ